MTSARPVLERIGERVPVPQPAFERLVRRRDRKRRNQRLAAGAVGLAIVLAGLLIGVRTSRSTPQPATTPTETPAPQLPRLRQPGEIAYSNSDGLFGKDPSTGATRKLADCSNPCGSIDSFAWSPNGTMIAYDVTPCISVARCEPAAGLWVKQADQAPRQLTSRCNLTSECVRELWEWSPDGTTIAYARFDGTTSQVSLLNPNDGALTPLTPAGQIGALSWSPDGSKIAFADGSGISLVTPNGAVSRVTDRLGGVDSIAWSPDGSRLLVDTTQEGRSRIYVVNADGSGLQLLEDGPDYEGPGAPSWSPDGTEVAYVTTPGPPPVNGGMNGHYGVQFWVVGADASGRTKVYDSGCCPGPDFDGPIWSPNGSEIAYMIDNQWYGARPDGTGTATTIDTDVVEGWQQRA